MAKEQPDEGYRVRPLFYQHGFQLIYIEQPFPIPEEVRRGIAATSIPFRSAPEPDILLGRASDRRGVYIEAKANSFSSADEKGAKQARGHLVASGSFSEALGFYESALLCYVVPDDRRHLMKGCLDELALEMTNAGFACGAYAVQGLAALATAIVFRWDQTFQQHCGLEDSEVEVMENLATDTDPTPLVLVYSGQDAPNPEMAGFYRRAFLEQVLARLVCDLELLPLEQIYNTTAKDLIHRMTDGIFTFVGGDRQKEMSNLVRQNLFRRIANHWKGKPFEPVQFSTDALTVSFKDSLAKSEFMDWLEDPRRTMFSDEMPKYDPQMLLIPEQADGG